MTARIETLTAALDRQGFEAFVVTKIENVRYLTGFSGSSACAVIAGERYVLVTDGRYKEQAVQQSPGWELVLWTADLAGTLAGLLGDSRQVGFENTITYGFYQRLAAAVAPAVDLQACDGLLERLRAIKDEQEVECISAALACALSAYEQVAPLVVAGATERELAAELDYRMMLAGSSGPAFDTIVASGPHSSMPHASVTERALEKGDLVVVDFGATLDGYRSDTTRTLVVGRPDERQAEVLEAVAGAQRAAIESLTPGMPATDADAAARAHLQAAALVEYFTHGLGHGVGLEVHERPTLSRRSEDRLEPGMVFTVEPGVYIEGWGGVRIEDMVLMTDSGPTLLREHSFGAKT